MMLAGYCSVEDYDKWVASYTEAVQAKTFYLPVTWSNCGFVEIKAANLESAVEYFKEHTTEIDTPNDEQYVDGRFTLSTDSIDDLRVMDEAERKRREA